MATAANYSPVDNNQPLMSGPKGANTVSKTPIEVSVVHLSATTLDDLHISYSPLHPSTRLSLDSVPYKRRRT